MAGSAIIWIRRDLRLTDNPALAAALAQGRWPVPVFIHAPDEEAPWQRGAASRWWLHHALCAFDGALGERGSRLVVTVGDSLAELRRIATATGADVVVWNRLYDPPTIARDARIKQALRADGLRCESFNAALLFEPWEIATNNGDPYRVFSAFWRKTIERLGPVKTTEAPQRLPPPPAVPEGIDIEALGLLPRMRWDEGLRETWQPGEQGALEHARVFLAEGLTRYGKERDIPGRAATSRLSPHLHFGEIGPRQLVRMAIEICGCVTSGPAQPFVRELGWREFAHHLLYHYPHTSEEPLDERFTDFPWRIDGAEELLAAWQGGRTGIPLVDAGMRELWRTGWMHNRIRMVVASLLTKNLRIPWQEGARWFWDTLVDADLANNTLGWQWTAGCGADAAPYFRVFNPVRQGERFDPSGAYVRRWCPELAGLPDKRIHAPWSASATELEEAGVVLGRDYPRPVADLGASRKEALAAWEKIKG